MTKRKNFIGHKKARQRVALDQVKSRIKRGGKAANTNEHEKKAITREKEAQRLEQAKYERNVLEKRI